MPDQLFSRTSCDLVLAIVLVTFSEGGAKRTQTIKGDCCGYRAIIVNMIRFKGNYVIFRTIYNLAFPEDSNLYVKLRTIYNLESFFLRNSINNVILTNVMLDTFISVAINV